MAFCRKCGNKITARQKFCTKCGEPVIMGWTALVKDALQGDSEASEELYRRTYRDKYYIALKYMKNRNDTEDVLQDSYLKAFEYLGRLQDPEKFPSWLSMIVANTAKNALAKKSPQLFTDLIGDNEEFDEDPILRLEDMDLSTHPEEAYLQSERRELLNELLECLTDEQRMAVMMFYVEELGTREIASALETNENTIKSRLYKARKALQKKAEELMKRGYVFSVAPLPFLVSLLRAEAGKSSGAAGGAAAGTAARAAAGSAAGKPGNAAAVTARSVYPAGAFSAAGPGTVSPAAGTMGADGAASAAGSMGAAAGAGAIGAAGAAASGGFLASVGAKIAVIAACLVLAGGAAFGGVKVVQHIRESRAEQSRENAGESIEEAGHSEDEGRGDAEKASDQSDDPRETAAEDTKKAAEMTEQPSEETEKPEDKTEVPEELTDSEAVERLTGFLEEELIPVRGVFNPLQVSYGVASDGMAYRFTHSWNAESCEIETTSEECIEREANFPVYSKKGIISAWVEDFSGNGQPELLVIYGEDGLQWNRPFSAELYAASPMGVECISSGSLAIPGRAEGTSAPVTEISVVESETGDKALMLYYQGKHSDVSIRHEACTVLPAEDFSVEKQYRAELGYESGGMPESVIVTEVDPDGSEGKSTEFDLDTADYDIDGQARHDIYTFSGYEETVFLTADHWDGAWDHSGFLEQYMLCPDEEDFSETEIGYIRDKLEYTEKERAYGYDAAINIDTVRFCRKDGEYSAILEKINAVIAEFTGDCYEESLDPASGVIYYTYTLANPIIADEYISVSGYFDYYYAGGAHGWAYAQSWVFSLQTGDPVDLRAFTGLTAAEIAERITLYFKDSGDTQKSVYEQLGMEYTADVSKWETDNYYNPSSLFRNIHIESDGWIYLENVCSPPATGGASFPSRVGKVDEFDLYVGRPDDSAVPAPGTAATETPVQESEVSTEPPTDENGYIDYLADSGVVLDEKALDAYRSNADYLIVNIDEETGKVIRIGYTTGTMYGGYYASCFWYHGDTLTFPYLYVAESGPYPEYQIGGTNAKEIVDNFFTYGNEEFASGGRTMVVWDSPYGLCAYDHSRSEYGGDTADLGYTFSTEDFEGLCRSIGLDMSYIPKSERQN